MANLFIQFTIIVTLLEITCCLQVIFERSNVTFFNTKYLEYGRSYIKRYSRKSPYYFNIEGRNKQTWDNNVTVHLVFDEYLHNEYRRSFVEMHYKACDLVNKAPYVGDMLTKRGVPCPLPPRNYQFLNMTIQSEGFPNVFPFEKGRVNVELTITDSGESIVKGYINTEFKANKKSQS